MVLDVQDPELLAELEALYREKLVPELVCAQPGYPDRPSGGWLQADGVSVYGARDDDGVLVGAWAVKDSSILFPVVDVREGLKGAVQILRALWVECAKHHEQLVASTTNPVIMEWAAQAMPTTEPAVITDFTLEWARGDRG